MRKTLAMVLAALFAASPALAVGLRLPERATESDRYYVTMRTALGVIESGGDVSARNKYSSASGKYQFVKAWDKFFLTHEGIRWTTAVPPRGASEHLKITMGVRQDMLFDTYYDVIISPWLSVTRKKKTVLSDAELVALAHRQGTAGADLYLRTGRDPFAGKLGNKHVAAHLRAMRTQMEFYNYLDTQTFMVKGKR
jgi:hypothetical protein